LGYQSNYCYRIRAYEDSRESRRLCLGMKAVFTRSRQSERGYPPAWHSQHSHVQSESDVPMAAEIPDTHACCSTIIHPHGSRHTVMGFVFDNPTFHSLRLAMMRNRELQIESAVYQRCCRRLPVCSATWSCQLQRCCYAASLNFKCGCLMPDQVHTALSIP
jgi:hypothetical protein